MTGGTGTFLAAPCARGGRADKIPLHPQPSRSDLRALGKPGSGGALPASPPSMSGPAEPRVRIGRCGSILRFSPAAQHSSKIRSSGRRCLAFAGGALLDTEQSSRNEVDPGFQAWCEGRLHGIPAERRAMKVSLFLTAFLAPHRVKASATPDQHFDPRHPRSRGDDRRQGGPFCRPPCARGGRAAKNPLHPRQADPISEPGASREGEALLACSPTSMSGPAETGSAWAAAGQFCGWQAASIGARGLLDPVAGAGLMFTVKAHLRKHRDLLQPPCDCPSPTR